MDVYLWGTIFLCTVEYSTVNEDIIQNGFRFSDRDVGAFDVDSAGHRC